MAKCLYSLGVDIHLNNDDAFDVSCNYGNLDIAIWLCSLGVDPHMHDDNLFWRSCFDQNVDAIKYLLSRHV